MSEYREFKGDQWLGRSIRLPGGSLLLMQDTSIRAAMKIAYTRAGKKAKVYRAYRSGQDVAVKVFFRKFLDPVNLITTGQLNQFRDVPGLRVCDRVVINDEVARQLGEPGLAFAILMPWIAGAPWIDVIAAKQALSEPDCIALARRTATTLAGLEARQLTHADISSTNVFIANLGPHPGIELIDVEDMYHPFFVDVRHVPDGTYGYGHPANKGKGCRNPFGDRFAGAILLTEMLIWHQSTIRAMAGEESLFAQTELCQGGPRFSAVRYALEAHSPRVAALFEQAWWSSGLAGCPSLAEWQASLATVGPAASSVPASLLRLPQPDRRTGAKLPSAAQTNLIDWNFCTECRRMVQASDPAAHAPDCSHHPARFTPEFDWSTWLTRQPGKPTLAPDFRTLLTRYSADLQACPACGKLVTGPTDDAHAPGCWNRQLAEANRPAAVERPLPQFDDVSFVSFDSPAANRFKTPAATPRPSTSGPREARSQILRPQQCDTCHQLITLRGTNQWGHRLTCPHSMLRKLLREL